jgi:ferredoxin
VPFVIAEPCVDVKDTACVDVCPVDCIHPRKDEPEFVGESKLYIDPDRCIDCGACVPACPVEAIFLLQELPARWATFGQIDAEWYADKDWESRFLGPSTRPPEGRS